MNTKAMTAEYRLQHWADIISKQNESGLNIREFCKNSVIPEWQYFYWQKKLRDMACEKLMKVQTESPVMLSNKFTEVRLTEQSVISSSITGIGQNQICIEILGIRLTASGEYPVEKLSVLLREMR
jgi:hypothetical protein